MPHLLICPSCGAPLPPPSVAVFVVCPYCRATSNVERRTVVERGSASQAELMDDFDRRNAALVSLEEALRSLSGVADIPFSVFQGICRQHLEALGATDTVARVAYNLALDFQAQVGHSVVTQGDALLRLARGYLVTVQELRTLPRYELSLPFFVVSGDGPLHYSRVLDVSTLIALSERDPTSAPPARAEQAASGEVESEDKPGFWAKLFGKDR